MEKFISFTDLKTESNGSLYISQCVQYVLYQITIFIYECHVHLHLTTVSDINIQCLVPLDFERNATNDDRYISI